MFRLFVLLFFMALPSPSLASANMPVKSQYQLVAKKQKRSKKRLRRKGTKRPRKLGLKEASSKSATHNISFGFLNLYPPLISATYFYNYKSAFHTGVEFGYMILPFEEFSGTSTYIGLETKYFLTPKYFAGLGLGRRTFTIATKAPFTHPQGETIVTWTRYVEQNIMTPKIGWYSQFPDSNAFYLAVGLVMPSGSTLGIERNVESIEGVPDSALDEEAENKADDVKVVTHSMGVLLEFKYVIGL